MDARLVVVGAGPFGLALAAEAGRRGVAGHLTIGRFLAERRLLPADVEPLPIELYLEYAEWFQDRAGLMPEAREVTGLRVMDDGLFELSLGEEVLVAEAVVLAVGQRTFAHVPSELAARLPAGRWTHTCDLTDLSALAGKRCLVVGGRQSAYEWAALLLEAGALRVDLVHRHAPPAFAVADWSWATAQADGLQHDPGWWRGLSEDEQRQVAARMWAEGRLKVEPWLEPRLQTTAFAVHAHRSVERGVEQADGSMLVELDDGHQLTADSAILATGYRPDAASLPFLRNLLPSLARSGDCLRLDESFQTSVPGLFATGALATADFGPFFGFTLAARPAAAVLAAAVQRYLRNGAAAQTY